MGSNRMGCVRLLLPRWGLQAVSRAEKLKRGRRKGSSNHVSLSEPSLHAKQDPRWSKLSDPKPSASTVVQGLTVMDKACFNGIKPLQRGEGNEEKIIM